MCDSVVLYYTLLYLPGKNRRGGNKIKYHDLNSCPFLRGETADPRLRLDSYFGKHLLRRRRKAMQVRIIKDIKLWLELRRSEGPET